MQFSYPRFKGSTREVLTDLKIQFAEAYLVLGEDKRVREATRVPTGEGSVLLRGALGAAGAGLGSVGSV